MQKSGSAQAAWILRCQCLEKLLKKLITLRKDLDLDDLVAVLVGLYVEIYVLLGRAAALVGTFLVPIAVATVASTLGAAMIRAGVIAVI